MLSLNPIYSALGGESATLATHTVRIFFLIKECSFSGCELSQCEAKMARDEGPGGNTKSKGVAVFALPGSHKHYIYFSSLNCLHKLCLSLTYLFNKYFLSIHHTTQLLQVAVSYP